ncbi:MULTISPECIES: hypothetical protein [unclassified Vibrio]|uniref:hypothetical protein n=1 Tax=unclassified Vibrio TaxID=2614977 RepID=UPI0012685289|nr:MULTISPECIES: hypothetical protein [unclassified Vibrio]QFT35242.1 hypothetical protein FIU99_02225 [Vibrio sp. THAF64]QGM33141.1 hypothetical protein GGC04_02230 [Vibrio sp. THAF191d]QGN68643.1 hypothetical protein GGC03_02225 [Vibrio sp. THAF191c]
MLNHTCKLCTFESKVDVQETVPFQIEHGVCEFCMDDIHHALKSRHQFNMIELHLRINLRKLRYNLQRITRYGRDVSSELEFVESEVSVIERELGELMSDYPSIAEVLSEYRSLLCVYK